MHDAIEILIYRILLKRKFICSLCLLLIVTRGVSQSKKLHRSYPPPDSLIACEKEDRQRDIVDVFRWIVNKQPVYENCQPSKKAGKLYFALLPAFGYSLVTKLAVVIAANGAFYTDNEPGTKLSVVNAYLGYTQNNQIIVPLLSNIWTRKNKYNLLGDWRYYKYPEYTYGLGGHTSVKENSNRLNYSNLIFREAVLRHIAHSGFYAGLAYNLNYHWNITETGNADGTESDFKKYGMSSKSISSGISVNALFDNRTNSINPGKAVYGSVSFCPNFTFLGSDRNYRSMTIDLRKYIRPGKSENILAFWSYSWFTFNGTAPYLDLPSTGWDAYSNMGRGYIQSRLRGKNLLYLETEYRFALTRNGLLGGVVFANAQSVTDWPSNKFQMVYPAVGAGIRVKINKKSNTNMSIDYAIGLNGSNGIFINLGEVF
jgi:hypothetical protein